MWQAIWWKKAVEAACSSLGLILHGHRHALSIEMRFPNDNSTGLWNECNYYKMAKDAVNTPMPEGVSHSQVDCQLSNALTCPVWPSIFCTNQPTKDRGLPTQISRNNAQFRTKINANGMNPHMNDAKERVQLATECTIPGLPGFARQHTNCMSECVNMRHSNKPDWTYSSNV